MPGYKAPARDAAFVINEVLELERYSQLAGYEAATPDFVATLLDEAGKFAAEVIAPLNLPGDVQGCTRHQDGSVTTPDGFVQAYGQFAKSGWGTLAQPVEFGGQDLPQVLGFAVDEFLCAACQSFSLYPGLGNGAVAAILASGSEEQKQRYLPNMIAGRWLGTMNLTEPQSGTDLGLLRTHAVPNDDSTYAITGGKIFISAGEHDLTENIIHLVLARLPDAPEGVHGISLFIVPKFLVNADGSLGARNAVSCGAVEHKMGIHANATCQMNYDGAVGYLVGEAHRGLAAMFVMMNAERLGVGIQGLGQAEVSYQNGAAYARERRQGRALAGAADPGQGADLLIVHPDVRRMLMEAKAFTEGFRALALWSGLLVDLARLSPDGAAREEADDLVGLLTPVIKAYGTEMGYRTATDMQQIWGGHGYIAENGMEQFVRDARIAMIYEGANGVQAMDLVGRKLPAHGGRAIQRFFALVDKECENASDPRLADLAARIAKANGELKAATLWLMQNAMTNPENAGAGAMAYLQIAGIVAIGLMWLRSAKAAAKALDGGASDPGFYEAKLTTGRYFGERFTPDAGSLRRKLETGAATMMALPEEAFGVA